MTNMRTPLNRVRAMGSSRSGTTEFWIQRLTALANLPLAVFLIALLLTFVGADHAAVHNQLAKPIIAIPLLFLVLCGALHMYLGMRVIIEDYIHAPSLKFAFIIANFFFSASIALISFYSVMKIALAA